MENKKQRGTYDVQQVIDWHNQGHHVFVAHSDDGNDDCPMLSIDEIREAEGHLFVCLNDRQAYEIVQGLVRDMLGGDMGDYFMALHKKSTELHNKLYTYK